MRELIKDYFRLEKVILNVIIAEFFLQLINAAFLSFLPLYMRNENYPDSEIANYTSYRFIGVLILAVFVGLYIKGRKVKSFFYLSAFFVPAFALLILYSVHTHNAWLNYTAQIGWGASFTFMQIPILPFILRNCPKPQQTSAISLSFATWSVASITGSSFVWIAGSLAPDFFNVRMLLHVISVSGFVSLFFIYRMRITEEIVPIAKQKKEGTSGERIRSIDWGIIIKALLPTLLLAVGAGFTIPFISLFFESVYDFDATKFSTINIVASALIAFSAMLVPSIKKNIGYRVAIPATQSFAIIALILMATTQFYSTMPMAVWIAVGAYLLRQPLMNLAGPMTSEVVMNYVGKKNREMMSALTAAIWSGSWFFSGKIFGSLRKEGVDYVNIFMITAALYTVGVICYYILILDHDKREKEGKLA